MPAQLLLPLVPEQGAFAEALDAVLARAAAAAAPAFGRHERALLAPGAQRARAISSARCPAGKRKELRRQRRRLEDIAPVTFATAPDAAGIEAALKDFLVLEASGWKGRAGTAIVNDPAIKDFVQQRRHGARRRRPGADRPAVFNGTAIAATVTLASGDTAWCWKIAYNEGARPLLARRAADLRSHREPAGGAAAAARRFLRQPPTTR